MRDKHTTGVGQEGLSVDSRYVGGGAIVYTPLTIDNPVCDTHTHTRTHTHTHTHTHSFSFTEKEIGEGGGEKA